MWDWRHLKTGSSPLARGLPLSAPHTCGAARIIPARAGFTGRRAESSPAGTDHPRSRGVYRKSGGKCITTMGSSPLARGLLTLDANDVINVGIIPARAGFTQALTRKLRTRRDHPRSRGVYRIADSNLAMAKGSSPLARGLPPIFRYGGTISGIIPARAGFTARPCWQDRERRDHPRSRGVYADVHQNERDHAGSSPLARGLRQGGFRL